MKRKGELNRNSNNVGLEINRTAGVKIRFQVSESLNV